MGYLSATPGLAGNPWHLFNPLWYALIILSMMAIFIGDSYTQPGFTHGMLYAALMLLTVLRLSSIGGQSWSIVAYITHMPQVRHVAVQSAPQKGTSSKQYLPRRQELENIESQAQVVKPQTNKMQGLILLVEDDQLVREFVASQLVAAGYIPKQPQDTSFRATRVLQFKAHQ